jgi:hypothetical protein
MRTIHYNDGQVKAEAYQPGSWTRIRIVKEWIAVENKDDNYSEELMVVSKYFDGEKEAFEYMQSKFFKKILKAFISEYSKK